METMTRLGTVFLAAAITIAPLQADRRLSRDEIGAPAPLPDGALLIVGFLGAWEEWDNPKRSVRKLALKLRDQNIPGVFVETADNHSRKTVRRFIHDALDSNHDGKLDPAEAQSAQIILYGQSFGGAACVMLAKELERWGVPVRLTVQVDSVGRHDQVIPANVKRAVNLFQNDPGPIRGRTQIKAADPSRTRILANIQHTYLFRDIDMSDYPKMTQRMAISHWKMDNDPLVWAEVETFIRAELAIWQLEQLKPTKP